MQPSDTALLLLCCTLGQAVQPLSGVEYTALRCRIKAQPPAVSDEIAPAYLRSIGYCESDANRIVALLSRRDFLPQYLQSCPALSVVTPHSDFFPSRLLRLAEDCPPVLFCKGDASLLTTRCVSLVGSRKLFASNHRFAEHIGLLAAHEGFTLVSGGAPGADSVAQSACLRTGGRVICFVPDKLTDYPTQDSILYCSDEGWHLPFSAARALRRNRYIHALGELTFIAQCKKGGGGTWYGAMLNLRRQLSKLCVFEDGSEATESLLSYGAVPATASLLEIAALCGD